MSEMFRHIPRFVTKKGKMKMKAKVEAAVRYYTVKVVAGEVVRVKKMKVHLPPRNAFGQFVGSARRCHGYCRWFGLCPFTTKGM